MSLISYASAPLKALSVPANGEYVHADDFTKFHGGEPGAKTEIKFTRSRTELFLEVICHETAEVRIGSAEDDWRIFDSGDRLEIFFGSLTVNPWLMQCAIGAGGGHADNTGRTGEWRATVEVGADYWKANAVFPISMFITNNHYTYFNICRYSEARKEYVTWMDLDTKFHEVENYGMLLFDDYSRVYFAETGVYPEKEFTRSEFEAAMEKLRIPAHDIQHGPWVSNASDNGMTVAFGSAGNCGAFLEYRPAGTDEWNRLPFERRDGLLIRNRLVHVLHLQGLQPAATYEYRVITLHPVTLKENIGNIYTFKTLDPARKEFTFTAFSDLHASVKRISNLLRQDALKKSDFLINIGDLLSCACGLESYYKGFLDLESKWCQNTGKSLYFVRGNHEQIGTFAGLYQDLLPHPAGKSYYTFRQGDTLFIALDAGNDKPDGDSGLFSNDAMIQEQQEWLKELSKTAEYRHARWRIALIHMPVYKRRYDSDAAFSLLRLIPETDLILSGHLHRYFTVEPETGVCFFKRENLTMVSPDTLSALTIANDTDTLLQVDVTEDHLTVNVIEQYGNVIDTLRIDPKK